jgi:biopolymer transport protein ExbD
MWLRKVIVTVAALLLVSSAGTAAGLILRPGPEMPARNESAVSAPLPAPESTTRKDTKVLYVNINSKGEVIVAGGGMPLRTPAEIEDYFLRQFTDLQAWAKERGDKAGAVQTIVMVRASEQTEAEGVCQVLRLCHKAGFQRLQLETNAKQRGGLVEYAGKQAVLAKPELSIIVKAVRADKDAGNLSHLVVVSPDGESSIEDTASLSKFLQVVRQDLKNKDDLPLYVDNALKFGQLIQTVDACLGAGFTHIHFLPEPEEPNALHAEARLQQALVHKRWGDLESRMKILSKRLGASQKKEEQDKGGKLKELLQIADDRAVTARADQLSELLAGQLPTLNEAKAMRDHSAQLVKRFEELQAELQRLNRPFKDEYLLAIEKSLGDLVTGQSAVGKLLGRYVKMLEDKLFAG